MRKATSTSYVSVFLFFRVVSHVMPWHTRKSTGVINSESDWRSFVPLDAIRKNNSHVGHTYAHARTYTSCKPRIRCDHENFYMIGAGERNEDACFLTCRERGSIVPRISGAFRVEYKRRGVGDKSLTRACIHTAFPRDSLDFIFTSLNSDND